MRQNKAVIDAISCSLCKVRKGQFCKYITGPCERRGRVTKACHPIREAAAIAPWKLWDGIDMKDIEL